MVLPPERWSRIEEHFEDLVDRPDADRTRRLAALSLPDEDRHLLARMLHDAPSASDRIAGAVGHAAHALVGTSDWSGRRFGPYVIVREVGRGGMGVVFEAARADDEYRKRVALKVAPAWRGDSTVQDRFRAERQILAELEHDNIARFLDGGTEDGVPYFAMEFVEGEAITAFCARTGASLAARLALFQQACAAVAFAHERLVIHRDLKPANILVTDRGVPKLVDFGVAKLLEPGRAADSTQTSAPAWTPDYVSPEQVRGQVITPRTDVYALGLILSELLSGERAQHADTSSLLALDRSVCDVEPEPPSATLTRRGLRAAARRVAGDLDTIVATAASKDPRHRYASVSALSDDITRYLEDRPILARPTGRVARGRKFVSRHRGAVSAGAVLLAVGAAGLVSTLTQARRAARRFQQLRSLANTFVFDVHDRIADLPGSTEARSTIVSTALNYLESLRDDAGGDPAFARELAAAYEKIGNVQGLPLVANLGDTGGALASYAGAIALLEPLVRAGDAQAQRQLVSTLTCSAIVRRARGDRAGALQQFGRARDVGHALLARLPDDEVMLRLLGSNASNESRAAFELRDLATAERAGREGMDLSQRLVALHPDDPSYLDGLGSAHNSLGALEIGRGRLESAAVHFGTAVDVRERLVAAAPLSTEFRRNLAVSYGTLADVLAARAGSNLGDTDGAINALQKAAALAEQARREDQRDRRALYDLANVRVRLGAVLAEADPPRAESALAELAAAHDLVRELLEQDSSVATYRYLDMVVARRTGDALALLGRDQEAVAALERAQAIARDLRGGPNEPQVRAVVTQAGARLAMLRALAGEWVGARADADAAASELAAGSLGTVTVDAAVHEQLGRSYAFVARGTDAADRADLLATARTHLEASLHLWRSASLAPALEPTRARAIEQVERALSEMVSS